MKTNKLMITCALCGGGTTRKQSPYVPLTPEELVADSLAAVRAGACILQDVYKRQLQLRLQRGQLGVGVHVVPPAGGDGLAAELGGNVHLAADADADAVGGAGLALSLIHILSRAEGRM